tara:strand:- start:490 stop:1086 length:597 start_codon:yes stop_codon:yes gene_type:complete
MNIAITNGSLSSLILSHMILDSNLSKSINITIFDEKAEIGFPNSGSGLLINKNKIFNLLETWCENFTFLPSINEDNNMIFNRSWLEKDLVYSLVKKGVDVKVKTSTEIVSSTELLLSGANDIESNWIGDLIINCNKDVNNNNYSIKAGSLELLSDDIMSEDSIEIIKDVPINFIDYNIDFAFNESEKLMKQYFDDNDK